MQCAMVDDLVNGLLLICFKYDKIKFSKSTNVISISEVTLCIGIILIYNKTILNDNTLNPFCDSVNKILIKEQ